MNQDFETLRKNPRRKIRIPVLCWECATLGGKQGRGKEIITKDLCVDGIGFYSEIIYAIGTRLALEVYLPGRKEPIDCIIRVARVEALPDRDDYVIGSNFCEIKKEHVNEISEAIGQMNIYMLLEHAVKNNASDVHLSIGLPPMVRTHGRIVPLDAEPIAEGQVEAMLFPLLSPAQIHFFEKYRELDFAFSPNLQSRFRVNMHAQKGFVEAALRSIPNKSKRLEDVGLPSDTIKALCTKKSGLLLIAGTTGAGKTTTLAAIIDYINTNKENVVITIEDPIEFVFKSERSVIKQRELGSDTLSYAEALRRSLRQDPDIVCVGEILDGECLTAAMRAAETGHLVISTIHAPSTIQAVERVVNFFPPETSGGICQQLSSVLLAIIYQRLVPCLRGGRVMASELMINTTAMKNLIRERKYNLMANVLQTSRKQGMYLLSACVKELIAKRLINEDVARELLDDQVSLDKARADSEKMACGKVNAGAVQPKPANLPRAGNVQ